MLLPLLATIVLGAAPAEPVDLEKAWQSRGDTASLPASIAAYEKAAQSPQATVQTFERLVRLRLLDAATRPEKSDGNVPVYAKCLADGLRGLSRFGAAEGATLTLPDGKALDEQRAKIAKPAAWLFYETAQCYGLTISSMPLLSQMSAAKRFKRLLERAVELDGTVKLGGPYRSLSFFLLTAPGFIGGDEDRARKLAEEALKFEPRYSDNVYLHALVVLCRSRKTKEECAKKLREAADLPDNALPELVPEQRVFKMKAREELKDRE